MRRRVPVAVDSEVPERSGVAHYRRVAPCEVRFVELCPGRMAKCDRKDVDHGWYTPPARLAALRARLQASGGTDVG